MKEVSYKQIFLFILILVSLLAAGCKNPVTPDSKNQAPYNIVGPDAAQQVALPVGTVNEYTLVVDEVDGLKDPDGDDVTFKYEVVSQTGGSGSDVVASLNETTGVFTLTHTAAMESLSVTVKFWTVDSEDEKSAEYTIVFSYEEDQRPSASFYTNGFLVSGSGNSSADQHYIESGTSNSRTKYSSTGSTSYELFSFWTLADGNGWALNDTHIEFPANTGLLNFFILSNDQTPPESGWSVAGINVIEVPIRGDVLTDGSTLTANYIFSDPQGDSEGSSTYKWFRCDNVGDEGVEITGENGITYVIDFAEDNKKYLRFEVTPVDVHGNIGTSVKSSASRMVDDGS